MVDEETVEETVEESTQEEEVVVDEPVVKSDAEILAELVARNPHLATVFTPQQQQYVQQEEEQVDLSQLMYDDPAAFTRYITQKAQESAQRETVGRQSLVEQMLADVEALDVGEEVLKKVKRELASLSTGQLESAKSGGAHITVAKAIERDQLKAESKGKKTQVIAPGKPGTAKAPSVSSNAPSDREIAMWTTMAKRLGGNTERFIENMKKRGGYA